MNTPYSDDFALQDSNGASKPMLQRLVMREDVEALYPEHGKPVFPRPIQYRAISAVYDTTRRASIDDPLNCFLKYYPNSTHRLDVRAAAQKAVICLSFASEVREGISWTVNHGESYLRM